MLPRPENYSVPFVNPQIAPDDMSDQRHVASSQDNQSIDYNMHQGVTNADIGGAGGDRFIDESSLIRGYQRNRVSAENVRSSLQPIVASVSDNNANSVARSNEPR